MATQALAYLDPGQFGGALQANATGFDWYLVAAYRDTGTGTKAVVSGIHAATLDADNVAQIGAKLGAAVKADGATRGFAITTVLLPNFTPVAV